MKSWMLSLMMRRGRVYILPTKMGGYLNGLIFLMFLLSVGYSNNLLLIFTLTLFAFNLAWVIQTHFHLRDLKLDYILASDAHAGSPHSFTIGWQQSPPPPVEWELKLINKEGAFPLKSLVQGVHESQGDFILPHRGQWRWQYLRVSGKRPFGLYQAWRYFKIELKHYAYPALIKTSTYPHFTELKAEGEEVTGQRGQGDFHGLAPYTYDEAKRISWKHYARSGELLIKEGEEVRARKVDFILPLPSARFEEELSLMASHMVKCQREEIPFSFQGPRGKLGPATHAKHLSECLRELGQC